MLRQALSADLISSGGSSLKNKPIRFITISLVVVICACIVLFTVLGVIMNRKSVETIDDVGKMYMYGLNERISKHFKTIIDTRLEFLDSVIENVPPEDFRNDYEEMCRQLIYSGEARGFTSISFFTEEGPAEVVYGDRAEPVRPVQFIGSLKDGKKKIAIAKDEYGGDVVLLGIPAAYTMKDGRESMAIVAGIPISTVKRILALDDESDIVFSHVIIKDGQYIIKNISDNSPEENYFDRLRSRADNAEETQYIEEYIGELMTSMENNEDFSSVLDIVSERRHIYCTSLPYSEWYLVTVMPYGEMNETVSNFINAWIRIAVLTGGVILIMIGIIFSFYYRMTGRQIKELKAARTAAENADKAKSEFLSNMSHDIRTPMNAIMGMTAIATANIDNKDQVKNCLKKITLSGKHLLGLINDVLDMSKIESGKFTLNMEHLSLREVMENIVNIVQPQIKAKNQRFDVFLYAIEDENVYGDSVRLNQVIINLLSNAVKFTPEGGKITVSLYEEDSPLGEKYTQVHIVVSDTGVGMSPEFKETIFESFTREDSKRIQKTEGTGLGMAITKYIVDAMKGTINVESEQNKGTTFHVIIDMEKASEQEEDMQLPGWRMLVVDDDEMTCKSTVASLKEMGITADWTLEGEEAVEMVSRCHNEKNDYQVLLLDWKLPGMSGVETAREVHKKLGDNVPIFIISAYDWADIETEARDAGVTGFISKPLFKSTLYYGLRQLMSGTPVQEQSEAEEDPGEGLEGRHILVAEDNDLNWEIANELLSACGLILDHAENGRICVEMFEKAETGYYDAVLMDIRMPEMTGYEAAQAIRRLDRPDAGLPIIAMTADAFAEDVKKCLDCGMNAHIPKPIDVREVLRVLKINIEQSK
ncbi:MAG: response regulator [Oscillospiraceae bacterium]|nr:response regulator [Oscillospiraceae bacterium]